MITVAEQINNNNNNNNTSIAFYPQENKHRGTSYKQFKFSYECEQARIITGKCYHRMFSVRFVISNKYVLSFFQKVAVVSETLTEIGN